MTRPTTQVPSAQCRALLGMAEAISSGWCSLPRCQSPSSSCLADHGNETAYNDRQRRDATTRRKASSGPAREGDPQDRRRPGADHPGLHCRSQAARSLAVRPAAQGVQTASGSMTPPPRGSRPARRMTPLLFARGARPPPRGSRRTAPGERPATGRHHPAPAADRVPLKRECRCDGRRSRQARWFRSTARPGPGRFPTCRSGAFWSDSRRDRRVRVPFRRQIQRGRERRSGAGGLSPARPRKGVRRLQDTSQRRDRWAGSAGRSRTGGRYSPMRRPDGDLRLRIRCGRQRECATTRAGAGRRRARRARALRHDTFPVLDGVVSDVHRFSRRGPGRGISGSSSKGGSGGGPPGVAARSALAGATLGLWKRIGVLAIRCGRQAGCLMSRHTSG